MTSLGFALIYSFYLFCLSFQLTFHLFQNMKKKSIYYFGFILEISINVELIKSFFLTVRTSSCKHENHFTNFVIRLTFPFDVNFLSQSLFRFVYVLFFNGIYVLILFGQPHKTTGKPIFSTMEQKTVNTIIR